MKKVTQSSYASTEHADSYYIYTHTLKKFYTFTDSSLTLLVILILSFGSRISLKTAAKIYNTCHNYTQLGTKYMRQRR